jgi:hypothetical protein
MIFIVLLPVFNIQNTFPIDYLGGLERMARLRMPNSSHLSKRRSISDIDILILRRFMERKPMLVSPSESFWPSLVCAVRSARSPKSY